MLLSGLLSVFHHRNFSQFLKFVLLPLQVHETVRTKVQQRRPCAVHQVTVRASDDPSTGDQHDAGPRSASYQPPQVRKGPLLFSTPLH